MINNPIPYTTGIWTPIPTGFTTVGTWTFAGQYTKIGGLVLFELTITGDGVPGSTISATGGGGTFCSLPFTSNFDSVAVMGDNNNELSNSLQIHLGNCFFPTFTETRAAGIIYGSGFYRTDS